jgi:hypothetical protein
MALFRAQVFLLTLRALFLCSRCSAMHATNVERNSWRLPPDDTVQVADQRSKSAEVSLIRGCTCSRNSDTVETGLPTPQPVTGHDPTAVPPVLCSYNALPWVLDPPFLSLTSPEGPPPLKSHLCPDSSNVPIRNFIHAFSMSLSYEKEGDRSEETNIVKWVENKEYHNFSSPW